MNIKKNQAEKPESELSLKIKRVRNVRLQTGVLTAGGGTGGCCVQQSQQVTGGYYTYIY
jgi:hypothetical protein